MTMIKDGEYSGGNVDVIDLERCQHINVGSWSNEVIVTLFWLYKWKYLYGYYNLERLPFFIFPQTFRDTGYLVLNRLSTIKLQVYHSL